jgi:hypothetical protein
MNARLQERTLIAENRVLLVIAWFVHLHEREPTVAELRATFGRSHESVGRRLKGLEKRGRLKIHKWRKQGAIKFYAGEREHNDWVGLDTESIRILTASLEKLFPVRRKAPASG